MGYLPTYYARLIELRARLSDYRGPEQPETVREETWKIDFVLEAVQKLEALDEFFTADEKLSVTTPLWIEKARLENILNPPVEIKAEPALAGLEAVPVSNVGILTCSCARHGSGGPCSPYSSTLLSENVCGVRFSQSAHYKHCCSLGLPLRRSSDLICRLGVGRIFQRRYVLPFHLRSRSFSLDWVGWYGPKPTFRGPPSH